MDLISKWAPLRHWGAPFLFVLITALTLTAPGFCVAPPRLDAMGNSQPVFLRGDRLEYHQKDGLIIGQGKIQVRTGETSLQADQLRLNLKTNILQARGDVAWSVQGNTVYARFVRLNLDTREGEAQEMEFRQEDWRVSGKGAKKIGKEDVFLDRCQATSCYKLSPHYRITAKEIHLVLGKRLTAKGVVLYTGVMPVLYVPWFTRNLQDPRPPVQIRPGYSERLGANVQITYNYFLNQNQYGALRYDYMEKWGHGQGLEHNYRFGRGRGKIGGYYTRNLANTQERWTAKLEHSQDLGKGRSLLARVDLLSDSTFNETFNQNQVDSSERRSFLSVNSSQSAYNWNIQTEKRQVLDRGNTFTASSKARYVTVERSSPRLDFSLYQRPVFEGQRLYYSFNSSMSRQFALPLSLSGYDETKAITRMSMSASPGLSYSLRLPMRNSVNARLGLQESFSQEEKTLRAAKLQSSYTARTTLRTRWMLGVSSSLTHNYTQALSRRQSLPFDGVTQNNLSGRFNLVPLESLDLSLATQLELRPFEFSHFEERFSLLTLVANINLGKQRRLGINSTLDPVTRQLKALDTSWGFQEEQGRWKFNLSSAWVNNNIRQQAAVNPLAPRVYVFEDPRRTPDMFLISTRTQLALTQDWSVSYFQRLNLTSKKVDEQAVTVWRSLHCWDFELSARQRIDGSYEFGFSLSLSAAPGVRASSNELDNEFFSDAHFSAY